MDGCALVSTNAGWNLAIGAFPRATGRFETLRSSDGCREVTGQVQQDRCWLAYGLAQIAAQPWRWLALVPKKLGYTFDHESFAVGYLREARPSRGPRSAAPRCALLSTFHRALVVAAALACVALRRGGRVGAGGVLGAVALVGLVRTAAACLLSGLSSSSRRWWGGYRFRGARRCPRAELPLALLGTTVLTHAVFFGEDRYHVVVAPVLACSRRVRSGAPPRRNRPSSSRPTAPTRSATTAGTTSRRSSEPRALPLFLRISS